MKKFVALVLAMLLVYSLPVALSEEEIELNRLSTTGNTTVSLTVNPARDSYIVVIPSKVEIDPVTQYGEATITLKSGWQLISVNGLSVILSDAENGIGTGSSTSSSPSSDITNGNYQNFKLKSEAGDTATYAIKLDNKTAPIYCDSTGGIYNCALFSINKGEDNTADQVRTLTFYAIKMPPAGVYTDTLTFSINTR